jgi:hypothetical protein
MDPDATYKIMVDPTSDLEERAVAATDLLVWLAHAPDWDTGLNAKHGTVREVADECKHHIFAALDRLNTLEATP